MNAQQEKLYEVTFITSMGDLGQKFVPASLVAQTFLDLQKQGHNQIRISLDNPINPEKS